MVLLRLITRSQLQSLQQKLIIVKSKRGAGEDHGKEEKNQQCSLQGALTLQDTCTQELSSDISEPVLSTDVDNTVSVESSLPTLSVQHHQDLDKEPDTTRLK